MRVSILPILPILLCTVVAAQADPRRNVVLGVTRGDAQSAPQLQRQTTDFAQCATTACALPGIQPSTTPWAGGTAVNGDVPPNLTRSVGGVWISNGRQLAQVDAQTCALRCAPQAAPLASATAEVTGLAYWEAEAALLMSDSTNLVHWVQPNGCTPTAVACDHWRTNVIPPGYTIAGLATDDVNRLLFVSAANFGQPTTVNKVWVAYLGFPSKPVTAGFCALVTCEVSLGVCTGVKLGPITGLGFDACTSTLYCTDGRHVVGLEVTYDRGRNRCTSTLRGCCTKTTGAPFSGLCVLQRQPSSVGRSCVMAPCISCPNMVAGTYGAAFLGNRNFALTLRHAPTGSAPAFVGISIGTCSLTGVNIGFCEPARIPFTVPPLLVAVRVPKAGATPCDGDVTISLGVPMNPAFCGIPVAVQWAMDCPGSPSGVGRAISNCVTFEITTN